MIMNDRRGGALYTDKGYDSEAIRERARQREMISVISAQMKQ